MGPQQTVEAGPSRRLPSSAPSSAPNGPTANSRNPVEDLEGADPRANMSGPGPSAGSAGATGPAEEGDDEGDEERMDYSVIQSFADKIQYLPSSSDINGATARISITIPKRGEKDFEPLQETVNLQDMMLQKSRQALFNALLGVRGGHSKSISHAILTPSHPYPRLLVVHGHMFDTMGITVRYPAPAWSKGKGKTLVELLPEEALYLLERGSLQIWIGPDVETEEEEVAGVGQWSDAEYGVKGAIEMSVMEGFATFIGREGLTWERYQAYAYLKRLGYTVQRSRHFIPDHFLANPAPLSSSTSQEMDRQDPHLPPFRTWWLSIPRWFGQLFGWISAKAGSMVGRISSIGLRLGLGGSRRTRGTLLHGWGGQTYASVFSHLRIVPAGHTQPLPPRQIEEGTTSIYDPLKANPYLPFFHVWKPAANWAKRAWDKGSEEGLKVQKPNYFIAAVEARSTPLPSLQQLSEIFDQLPDEPKGPIRRQGPQYQRPPRPAPSRPATTQNSPQKQSTLSAWLGRLGLSFPWTHSTSGDKKSAVPHVNVGALRNGDRGLVVAVNDSGNTGWVRFGRTGFAEAAVI